MFFVSLLSRLCRLFYSFSTALLVFSHLTTLSFFFFFDFAKAGTTNNSWDFVTSEGVEGNTGFYYARSNERTVKLWYDAFSAVPNYEGLDDQAVFWKVIRSSHDPPVIALGSCRNFVRDGSAKMKNASLTTCFLDPCVFSSGMISRKAARQKNLRIPKQIFLTIHANFLVGNSGKQKRMEESGLWLATHGRKHGIEGNESQQASGCKKFVVPLLTQRSRLRSNKLLLRL